MEGGSAVLCFLTDHNDKVIDKPPLPLGQLTHYHKKPSHTPSFRLRPISASAPISHLHPYLASPFSHVQYLSPEGLISRTSSPPPS